VLSAEQAQTGLPRPELQAADAYCRRLANRHYENFSVAGAFLPRELRVHLARIYAFCRTTDDLGDEYPVGASPATPGARQKAADRLRDWRRDVEALWDTERIVAPFTDATIHQGSAGSAPIHPVLLALAPTIERFDLPRQPFLDLIDANLQDQQIQTYETWDELRRYCTLSAAPVGRMVLGVFEVRNSSAVPLSDDVCIGLQLANFAQDVSVDRAKGRTYLLQSELRAGGSAEAVRRMCERAARLLASGEELERMVTQAGGAGGAPGWLRVQLTLYRLGGQAILEAIRRAGYRTDRERPTVSTVTKLRLLPLALLQSARGDKDVES
jgi:squalene synthase HpnC